MSSDGELSRLCEWTQSFWQRGWLPASAGNFSLRLPQGGYALTLSGRHKGQLSPEDFVALDKAGQVPPGSPPSSAETGLHLERYAALPKVNCVMHTHSPYSTLLSRLPASYWDFQGYEVAKAFAGVDTHESRIRVPVFDNNQNIQPLAKRVRTTHAQSPIAHAYLIRGHGVYTWGESVDQAAYRLEALEFLIQCAWMERA